MDACRPLGKDQPGYNCPQLESVSWANVPDQTLPGKVFYSDFSPDGPLVLQSLALNSI